MPADRRPRHLAAPPADRARPPHAAGRRDAAPSPDAAGPAGASRPRRRTAVLQALFVTALWSSSWVLISLGLRDERLDPILFAGLRYSLAALVLLPMALPALRATAGRRGDRRLLARVAALGLVTYALTQGAQFVALSLLPAVAASARLTATPVVAALLGWRLAGERPGGLQSAGVAVLLVGAGMYFGHVELGGGAALGLAAAGAGTLANASSALLGRSLAAVARERLGGVLPLTALSMAVGGATLLAVGLAGAGPPTLSPRAWAIVGWLALVNTAAAFTLWNHTLKTLSAVESSALNNTMLIQIAALAWIFLDQPLDGRQIVGLALAAAGALLVQLGPAARPASGAARPT